MAKFNIPTTVETPDTINIRFVREDDLRYSEIFRIAFEVCLSLFAVMLGNAIAIKDFKSIPTLNLFCLGIFLIGAIIFIILYYSARSRSIIGSNQAQQTNS